MSHNVLNITLQTPTAFRPFEDISGCDGVFVCSQRPLWIMCSHHSKVKLLDWQHMLPHDATFVFIVRKSLEQLIFKLVAK